MDTRNDHVLIAGSPRDPTFRYSAEAFHRQGRRPVLLDLDRFCRSGSVEGRLDDPASLSIRDGEEIVRLDRLRACYARFIELPLDQEEQGAAPWSRRRMLQAALSAADLLVVNRPDAGESNDSKPLQTWLLRQHGFHVPRSCTTNDADAAAEFIASCPRGAIYKSNSGFRSIVQPVTAADLDRLALLTTCPVLFQERIWGDDIRVHVVRDRCHAVLIRSPATDYRYDTSGLASEMPFTVPADLAARCVEITALFGLEFSGIDFVRSAQDGTFYCLEVNPMPGYHGYDLTLRGEISHSLGDLLFA